MVRQIFNITIIVNPHKINWCNEILEYNLFLKGEKNPCVMKFAEVFLTGNSIQMQLFSVRNFHHELWNFKKAL